MLTVPVYSKDCMKSASYEYRKMSADRGAQFVPVMLIVCWKTFPTKTTKILSTSNSNILMMLSSEYLFIESECSFTKYFFVPKYQIFVSAVNVFEIEGVSDNTVESVSQFLVGYGCIKRGKTWCLLHGWKVEVWIVKDPHLIDPTSRVSCFAVLRKTLLIMCKQFCQKNG